MRTRRDIVVFDFETTGLTAYDNDILEIGAIKYTRIDGKLVITDEFQAILKTKVEISPKITEITNITKHMQETEGISQEEGFARLSSMIESDTLLVAYNIQFDYGFLTEFYHRYLDKSYVVENDLLDVMAIYKDRHNFPHRLESAIETYNINLVNSHRALDDAKATMAVLVAMYNEREDKDIVSLYINVIGRHYKYGVSGLKHPKVDYSITQYGKGGLEIEKAKK